MVEAELAPEVDACPLKPQTAQRCPGRYAHAYRAKFSLGAHNLKDYPWVDLEAEAQMQYPIITVEQFPILGGCLKAGV